MTPWKYASLVLVSVWFVWAIGLPGCIMKLFLAEEKSLPSLTGHVHISFQMPDPTPASEVKPKCFMSLRILQKQSSPCRRRKKSIMPILLPVCSRHFTELGVSSQCPKPPWPLYVALCPQQLSLNSRVELSFGNDHLHLQSRGATQ